MFEFQRQKHCPGKQSSNLFHRLKLKINNLGSKCHLKQEHITKLEVELTCDALLMYQKPHIVFMVIICVDTDDQLFYSQIDLLTSKSIH